VKPKPFQTPAPIVIRSGELVLREWQDDDISHMVEMFNTPEMERWTPVAHPFDVEAAKDFLRTARQGREWGLLQLAITEGGEPLGEVRLFPCDDQAMVEYAYGVGSAHRGRHLASRAVVATFPQARDEGYSVARIRVPIDNVGSAKVAKNAGFTLTDEPLIRHEARGNVYDQATWLRPIDL
jgi:RimJ/RimL family protein N-acetyltransferase